ncbi:MAG: SCO family protein [Gammaproteobacteria bacterium]|nr:SCO family protein [Gammaproteobacteria bacterium]
MNRHHSNQRRPQRNIGNTKLLFLAVMVVAVAMGIYLQQQTTATRQESNYENLIILPKTRSLGDVNFIANDGSKFDENRLKGKWTILFFAFTNCPDICPSTLHTLGQVKQELDSKKLWGAFQLAMITVDPERDTIERLNQYVPFYDPSFMGLRGERTYTEAFAKNVGILFFKREQTENGGYDVDHGASLILVDPKGNYAGVIPAPHSKEVISADLAKLAKSALDQGQITTSTQTLSSATSTFKITSAQSKDSVSDIAHSSKLVISDPWIRNAPPNAMALAGYAILRNKSDNDISVVGVRSPMFEMAMIHSTIVKDGVASMKHLDELKIDARSEALLKPMGTHMMLMRPSQALKIGDVVPIELSLRDGTTLSADFVVKTPPEE